MQFIDLNAQLARIRPEVEKALQAVFSHGQYILGPEVAELESQLAAFVKVKHCVTVSSGTDALLMAMMALELKPGDEVITSSFTFFATAEMMLLLGVTPVFVDIDPDTYNLDPKLLEAAITPKTAAIMPVSLYGQCADLHQINEIASKYSLPVIEDAAQSFGAQHHGQRSCGLTTIGCTSFFPSKPLGCYGDGGACFTHDDELADKLRSIRVHGQRERYEHVRLGLNGRFDTIQAAMMLPKLTIFEDEIAKRQQVAQWYAQYLPESIRKPIVRAGNLSVFAQYTIEVEDRQTLQTFLQSRGIPTAVHYPKALHQQPLLLKKKSEYGNLRVADKVAERVLSLPFYPYLTEKLVHKVCKEIENYYI